ncbi:hypothetical protein Ciccas_010416 [Cichlidogyrus casuarinus]|uniref:Major facilitator superfamily (MFS) profile domain-containing protein n=1 Tax=Cichlidogyrus casuarinus TaxID=1844966 RepID=A0ABD2PU79_9PLAT
MAVGMGSASYVGDIVLFSFLYGIVGGAGVGICLLCAIVAVNYQFDKLRGLASGIGMSGAGFGYLIVPLLVQNVLQRFDWRTSLLVLGIGFGSACFLCSLTYLKMQIPAKEVADQLAHDNDIDQAADGQTYRPTWPQRDQNGELITVLDETEKPQNQFFFSMPQFRKKVSLTSDTKLNDRMTRLLRHVILTQEGESALVDFVREHKSPEDAQELSNVLAQSHTDIAPRLWQSTQNHSVGDEHRNYFNSWRRKTADRTLSHIHKKSHMIYLPPFDQADIFFTGTLDSLAMLQAKTPRIQEFMFRERPHWRKGRVRKMCLDLVELFDLRLLIDPAFLIILLAFALVQFIFLVPFFNALNLAAEVGVSKEQAMHYFTAMGMCTAIGRIAGGALGTVKRVNNVYLALVSVTFGGLAALSLGFIPLNYWTLMVYFCIHSIALGIPTPLIGLLLTQYIGLGRLTAAFSNHNMFKGFLCLPGPIVAKALNQLAQTTFASCYLTGAFLLASGLVFLGLPVLDYQRRRRSTKA